MTTRILETVLTGRNLLSPVLTTAARDVEGFQSTVTAANEKAGVSASASARTQQAAAGTTTAASERAAVASTTGSTRQAAAAEKIAASNAKASTSASASADVQSRSHAKAAESATLSARLQETANRGLSASNGLLGTSLTSLTAGLGAVALGFAYAGYRGMEFDSAMSEVQAATQASTSTMNELRDAAIEQGAQTKYSAEEAAQGITEMAKAGVSTADIMGGGLAGALDLAAAGQISVAEAAETGATALSVFNLEGDQMSHVADLLAAGAGKAQGSVGDLSAALNQSSLVANQTGLSIEDTAGALAMFASNGLTGSDAGTSFKTMLQALTPNSDAAAKAMDSIGFSAYDAQGNFVGLESVAGQLREGLSTLSVEQQNATLKTIFGSDAVRAAAILYNEGADGVSTWRDKVNDAGYAQEQAAQLTDNLRGDLERLGGAFDSTMTTIGTGTQGTLRELVQMLTWLISTGGDVVGFLAGLPGPVLAGVAAFTAFTLLRGPLDAVFTRLAAGLTSTVTGMGMATGATTTFGIAAGAARTALVGFLTTAAPFIAVAAISAGVASILSADKAAKDARESIETLLAPVREADNNSDRLTAQTEAIQGLRDQSAAAQAELEDYNNRSTLEKLWEFGQADDPSEGLRDAVDQTTAALDEQEAAADRANKTIDLLASRYHISRDEVLDFADAHSIDLTGALDDTQWTFDRLAGSTGAFTTQLGDLSVGAQNAYTSMAAYAEALGLDEDATKDLTDQTHELGESLAGFVDPLSAYTTLLDEKKQAEQDAAQVTADASVSFDDYMTKLQEQVAAQDAWQTNMLRLSGRVSSGTIEQLADMGVEGADLVAQLVTRSDAELDQFDDLASQRAQEATDAWGETMTLAQPVLAAIGRTAGQGVVDSLSAQLQAGTTTVADIAAQYGVNLAGGINPVLTALGKQKVVVGGSTRLGQIGINADGNLHEPHNRVLAYKGGAGREDHVAQIASAGDWRVWAEPETPGSAFIPLAPHRLETTP